MAGQTTIELAFVQTEVTIDTRDPVELALCKCFDVTDTAYGQCVEITSPGAGILALVFDFVTNVANDIVVYIPARWQCVKDINGSPIAGARDSRIDADFPDLAARGTITTRNPL